MLLLPQFETGFLSKKKKKKQHKQSILLMMRFKLHSYLSKKNRSKNREIHQVIKICTIPVQPCPSTR